MKASPTQALDKREINTHFSVSLRIKVEDKEHNEEEEIDLEKVEGLFPHEQEKIKRGKYTKVSLPKKTSRLGKTLHKPCVDYVHASSV